MIHRWPCSKLQSLDTKSDTANLHQLPLAFATAVGLTKAGTGDIVKEGNEMAITNSSPPITVVNVIVRLWTL